MFYSANISVIVPVYNVEKYIDRCIQSILTQTYSDYEIILIDDGSVDRSGDICDKYANSYAKIRVIHNETNQGLAEVRNIGIREAKGRYIQFVDSDDWIEPETLELCLNIMCDYDADIVCYRFCKEYEDKEAIIRKYDNATTRRVFKTNEALEYIFFPKYIDTVSCNKLIKKQLFSGVFYPKGKYHEDLFTTYKFVANANKIVCLQDELYHYYQNPKSIGHMKFSMDTYDIVKSVDECMDFIKKRIGHDSERLLVGSWFRKMFVINSMIKSNSIDINYIQSFREEMSILKVAKCKEIGIVRKFQMMILGISFKLYRWLYLFSKQNSMGGILVKND